MKKKKITDDEEAYRVEGEKTLSRNRGKGSKNRRNSE